MGAAGREGNAALKQLLSTEGKAQNTRKHHSHILGTLEINTLLQGKVPCKSQCSPHHVLHVVVPRAAEAATAAWLEIFLETYILI